MLAGEHVFGVSPDAYRGPPFACYSDPSYGAFDLDMEKRLNPDVLVAA